MKVEVTVASNYMGRCNERLWEHVVRTNSRNEKQKELLQKLKPMSLEE